MAWPATPLPVTVEAALGADLTADPTTWTWTDVTQWVRVRDLISLVRGRRDWATTCQPTNIAMTVDNTDGRWTARNPLGAWYGQMAKGTPLRVVVSPDSYADAFARTVASGWGSADTGQAWSCVGGSASDYSVGSGIATQSHTNVNVMRASVLDLGVTDVDYTVDTRLPVLTPSGGSIGHWVAGRYSDANNYYVAILLLDTVSHLWLQLYTRVGGVLTLVGRTTLSTGHSAGDWWRIRLQVLGPTIRAKAWSITRGETEPAAWQSTATDDQLTTGTAIALMSRLEAGNGDPLPEAISWDNLAQPASIRATGQVSQLPPQWDISGADQYVPVVASGVTRRLLRGKTLRSPLYRAYMAEASRSNLLAYWPCEDASGATLLGSATGGPPMVPSGGVLVASDTGVVGSQALPTVPAGGAMSGAVRDIPVPVGGYYVYGVRGVVRVPTRPGSTCPLLGWIAATGQGPVRWQLVLTPGSPDKVMLRGYDATGAELVGDAGTAIAATDYGLTWAVSVDITTAGPGIGWTWTVTPDSDSSPPTATGTLATGAVGWVTRVDVTPTADVIAGHLAVTADTTYLSGVHAQAAAGWAGETAGTRAARLGTEEGLSVQVAGSADTPMGPQSTGTLLTLLRECADADGGILHDAPDVLGLVLRARSDMYNGKVVLPVSYAEGQVYPTLAPADDDAGLVNDVTASRSGGGSARFVATDGPCGTDAVGTYDDTPTIGVAADQQLPYQAQWRVHLGTVDELRWPTLTVDLAGSPELVSAWLATTVGDRTTVDGMPAQAGPDPVDQLVQGWTETLNTFGWKVVANCSPARPWEVFRVADSRLGRIGSDGVSLHADITVGATAAAVDVVGPSITTTDLPVDLTMRGERVSLTAVAGLADAFGRTVASGWGTADVGLPWTCSGGSASDYSVIVSGYGRAQQSHSATATIHASALDVGGPDQDYTVDAMLGVATATGGSISQWVCGRYTDASNCYIARLDLQTTGRMLLSLFKRVGGALNGLGSGVDAGAQTASHWWRVRLQVIGSSIKAKAWDLTAGQTEPRCWTLTVTDTALTTGTAIGLMSRLETGNTNTPPVIVSWDNLTLLTPAWLTLTRAVNGVGLAHPAGTPVTLWRPGTLAL